ncbi:MAG: TRAP transporter large permease subunit [Actinomycetota bacterium]|nr:TRAP transporter large permease subunit [Actinomycetota bacterium]
MVGSFPLLSVSENPVVLLLLINGLVLALGLIMDMAPLIMVMPPILLPIATDIGVDLVHFGIILLFNLCIGLLTPPVGNLLFAGIVIGDISIERGARALVPFYAVLIAVLLLVTFVPALAMTLARLLGALDRRCNSCLPLPAYWYIDSYSREAREGERKTPLMEAGTTGELWAVRGLEN